MRKKLATRMQRERNNAIKSRRLQDTPFSRTSTHEGNGGNPQLIMRSGTLLFLCGMLAISCVRVERAFADQLHSEALHSRKPGALLRSSRPQIAAQITWMYAHSLEDGANFLGETLQLEEVPGLAQKEICRIFHAAAGAYR